MLFGPGVPVFFDRNENHFNFDAYFSLRTKEKKEEVFRVLQDEDREDIISQIKEQEVSRNLAFVFNESENTIDFDAYFELEEDDGLNVCKRLMEYRREDVVRALVAEGRKRAAEAKEQMDASKERIDELRQKKAESEANIADLHRQKTYLVSQLNQLEEKDKRRAASHSAVRSSERKGCTIS